MKNLTSTALRYESGKLLVLDQHLLPHQETWRVCQTVEMMETMIQTLQIRGAPLIGVGAALLVACLVEQGQPHNDILDGVARLRQARPTAVNLMHCMDRMAVALRQQNWQVASITCAEELFEQDQALCAAMASNGAALVKDNDRLLTHCNAGSLATAGVGTAIGVITQAWRIRQGVSVWVDETRPLLQGGRLTAWEMERAGIPYQIICDNMAASLMQAGKVDKVFVGSDRIAANGDFANKVGTYNLAVLAHFHAVPFYVVAPCTTVDANCKSGEHIPIEQRAKAEVTGVRGSFGEVSWSPEKADAFNPAFDVTPASMVTAWVLDSGVYTLNDIQRGILKGTSKNALFTR
ncbi:MAG: S-methyl-5-thioribose-1-phosphate isomerase [Gammaproteobacteria bacterium]|nr:S-methyl-5-thioribose-1-phosphate isomerase [Gammaproteobacteria bacterium]